MLNGVATMALPNPVVGLFSVKCGKANAKKGTAKVSATYTPISGKKKTYKAQLVDVTSGAVTVAWDDLAVTIDGDTFSGSDSLAGGIGVGSADVGGDWTRTDATVQVELTDGALPEGTFEDLLPDGEPVVPKAGKWAFAKATAVKWAKPKNGTDLPEIYDETTGKGLIIDDSKGKTNLSAMKLTYTPKTGIFKGSFKVYALQNGRLRKFTAKANGVVVEGTGYGIATIPNGPTFFVSVK